MLRKRLVLQLAVVDSATAASCGFLAVATAVAARTIRNSWAKRTARLLLVSSGG